MCPVLPKSCAGNDLELNVSGTEIAAQEKTILLPVISGEMCLLFVQRRPVRPQANG